MPTDDDRDLPFHAPLGDVPDLPRLSASTVIRRSRRRRLVQQVAVGGVGALAVVGIVGGIGLGFRSFGFASGVAASGTAGSATDGAASPEFSGGSGGKSTPGVDGTPTRPRFDCGAVLSAAPTTPNPDGLSVELRITRSHADSTAATGRVTVISTKKVPDELSSENPLVVIARGGLVTSVLTVDSVATPEPSALSTNGTRVISGRLSGSTCGAAPGSSSATDDFLVVIPVLVDGETRWITTVPGKVSIR